MIVVADRVKEYSSIVGTGAITLEGVDQGYRTFASVCSANDQVYYCITHRSSNEWEIGLGTFTTGILTRSQLLDSSSGSVIDFTAGGKDVFITQPGKILDIATRSPGLTLLGRNVGTDGPISRLSVSDVKTMLGLSLSDIQGVISIAADNRAINNSGVYVPEVTTDLVAIYNAAKI
jgi:hypothetical protein